MEEKTNVMRLLEQKKIAYTARRCGNALSGTEAAAAMGEDVRRVFKTLVTRGKSGAHYVFMIPVAEELDLKKAAAAAGEKSISMLLSRELLPLTGYVHGGCSPIGMKKIFPTFLDKSALDDSRLLCSAGKIGFQVEVSPCDLIRAYGIRPADLTVRP